MLGKGGSVMNSKKHITRKRLVLAAIIAGGLAVLFMGPYFINKAFLAETADWNVKFTAGETLQYYGLILGGLVTGIAIITTIHLNNVNRYKDWQRQQFERTYAIYHKLPEILTKLELSAVHVQYAVRLEDEKLIEALDVMKKSDNVLREHHYKHDIYYSREIEASLKKILEVSTKCEDSVEHYLLDEKNKDTDLEKSGKAMEDAFDEFRESIKNTKSDILAEINQFVSVYDNMV